MRQKTFFDIDSLGVRWITAGAACVLVACGGAAHEGSSASEATAGAGMYVYPTLTIAHNGGPHEENMSAAKVHLLHDGDVALGSIMSSHGPDPVVLRMRPNGSGGIGPRINIMIQEEQSEDTEVAHRPKFVDESGKVRYGEKIGLVMFPGGSEAAPGIITGRRGGPAGAFETVGAVIELDNYEQACRNNGPVADGCWRYVAVPGALRNSTGFNNGSVVVFAQVQTFAGAAPAMVRLRNVTAEGFYFRVDEWDYADGYHAPERVSFLITKTGNYWLPHPDRRFEVKKVDANHQWSDPFSYPLESDRGVVNVASLAQTQTFRGADAVTVRTIFEKKKPDSYRYNLRLQEQESKGGHATETIGFFRAVQYHQAQHP